MVTENEKDYSDYIQYASSSASVLSLLSGFTFTAFTILLAQLPDPSSIISQFTLFFLAALFYIFITLLAWLHTFQMIRYCKNVPPASKGLDTFNYISALSYIGLQFYDSIDASYMEPHIPRVGNRNYVGTIRYPPYFRNETIPRISKNNSLKQNHYLPNFHFCVCA